jgi:hypothetical protein
MLGTDHEAPDHGAGTLDGVGGASGGGFPDER